jgi:hypothetical protein
MTVPAALVIGPMKSGTTWIHDYLSWRGDVCLPRGVKETFFFDRYYERGHDWYANNFSSFDAGRHRLAAEVAPSLFHDANAPQRVRDVLGPIPLVVTLRDPVRRSWSHYQHLRRKGYTKADLPGAISEFPEIIDASRYELHIDRWRAASPGAELSVLESDQLARNTESYVRDLCAALGLPYRAAPADLGKSNSGGVAPSFRVARVTSRVGSFLRSQGLHWIVNAGRGLG